MLKFAQMYLKFFHRLIYSLHHPIHVERFQKYFGLQIIQNDIDEACGDLHNNDNHNHLTLTKHDASNGINHKHLNRKEYRITNYFWYYLFSFGARLGYELFYAFSFSYLYWNIDSFICRRLMLVWGLLMYTGQALKDLIRLPRPNSKNIIILEPKYSFEYGMPSTHAMLALMVPVTLFNIVSNRYEMQFSMLIYVFFSVAWCSLICCSRLYLGMHSVLDIIIGLLLTSILLVPVLYSLDYLDNFLAFNRLSPLVLMPTILLLSVFYPASNSLSPSRGDTITIISAVGGVYLGTWLNYQLGIIKHNSDHWGKLYSMILPTMEQLPTIAMRTILGLATLFSLRSLGEQIAKFGIKFFTGIKDLKQKQHLNVVEIPIKLIPFLLIGLAISFFGPLISKIFQIERQSMTFEA